MRNPALTAHPSQPPPRHARSHGDGGLSDESEAFRSSASCLRVTFSIQVCVLCVCYGVSFVGEMDKKLNNANDYHGWGYDDYNRQAILHTDRPKKKTHTLIFIWKAIYFDYVAHLLWHCFDNLMQCHLFPSRVAYIFGRYFVLMSQTIGESNHSFTLKDFQWS